MKRLITFICVAAMAGLLFYSVSNARKKFRGEDEVSTSQKNPDQTTDKSTQPPGSPEEIARNYLAEGQVSQAFDALRNSRSHEALELLLAMLEFSRDYNHRLEIVKHLGKWPDQHEKISDAFMLILTDSFSTEISEICRILAAWNMKQHAVALAELLVHNESGDYHDYFKPVSQALGKIGTPDCVPILIAAIPASIEDRKAASALVIGNSSPVPRLEAVINALGDIRDPRAAPILIDYFNAGAPAQPSGFENRLWETVSVALGKIGTEETIAAMEAKIQEEKNVQQQAWLRQRLLPGLMRSRHPKGRAALAEALAAMKDGTLRGQAVDALVETATADDAALILKAVADPNPLFVQKAIRLVSRLPADARASVEQACDQLMQNRRFRTALKLAEKLADEKRIARAKKGLDGLREAILGKPRLHDWLGMSKAKLASKFPTGKVISGGEGALALVNAYGGRSYTWSIEAREQGVWLWTDVFGDGPCQHVEVREPYSQPVYGAKIGDPATLAWEIHGETVGDPWFAYYLDIAKDLRIHLTYSFDNENKIMGAQIDLK